MKIKPLFIVICSILLIFHQQKGYSQNNQTRQDNTTGSDICADIPHTINILEDSVIPVTIYLHESNCFNCNNFLTFVDISLKGALQTTYNDVINYHSLSYSDFLQMFSEYSSENASLETQSFLNTLPERDSDHTIIFTADTNFWIPPIPTANITSRYFYFNINIPVADWIAYAADGAIDIKVTIGIDYETDTEQYFRVFTTNQTIPSLPGVYRGDTHYHSINTQNDAENGLPLDLTKRAAKILGIDWITTTDHSCDYDNYGPSMNANWQRLGDEIQTLNNADSSMVFIRGVEASVKNSADNTVHALIYPQPESPFSLPFIFDGGGDVFSTSLNVQKICDSLQLYNGFCYSAHPFSEGDELSFAVDGGIWNVNDPQYPLNGEICPPIGTVLWNDVSKASDIYSEIPDQVFKSEIRGIEIYNMFNYLSCDDTKEDPWNTNYETEPFGFQPVDPTNILSSFYRFKQNQHTFSFLLLKGLIEKNLNPSSENWKIFMSGGSDAHGSFNYSSTEYIAGGIMGQMTENAPGKMVTLAYSPLGMGPHGQHVLHALKDGHTAISTGPVLSFKLQNPDTTIIPGDDMDVSVCNPDNVLLQFSAATNEDFGDLTTVEINVSTQYGELQTLSYPISSGNFEISLQDLAEDLELSGSPLPENQYSCIRAEIFTTKTYNAQETIIRRINELEFYCKTNPIWIKTGTWVNSNEVLGSGIYCYPNPAKEILYISFDKPMLNPTVDFVNSSGIVSTPTSSIQNNSIVVNTSGLTNGIYSVRIKNNERLISKKVVILK